MVTEEQAEVSRLRRENAELRMERDILKKATAYFATESLLWSRGDPADTKRLPVCRALAACSMFRPAATTHGSSGNHRNAHDHARDCVSRHKQRSLPVNTPDIWRGALTA